MILEENWNDDLSLHDSLSHLDSLNLSPPRSHIAPFWWLSDNSIRLRLGCVPPQTVMDPWLQLEQLLLVDLQVCGPDLTVEIRSHLNYLLHEATVHISTSRLCNTLQLSSLNRWRSILMNVSNNECCCRHDTCQKTICSLI